MAVALSHDAQLLILDEPTSGLDPAARDEILPLFFKLGYSKAKFFTVVPFLVIMAGFLAFTELINNTAPPHVLVNFIDLASSNYIFMVLSLAALLCIWAYASYRLSLAFYRKREF